MKFLHPRSTVKILLILVMSFLAFQPANASFSTFTIPKPIQVKSPPYSNASITSAIIVTPTSGLITTEAGGTALFTVVLESQPNSPVKIDLHSSDTSEGTISTGQVTFNQNTWDSPQTVVITGVDDTQPDGDIAYQIITNPASSKDPAYNGLNPADVNVTNLDNEPVANPDSDTTDEDQPVTTNVLANDNHVLPSATLNVVKPPAHGTTTVTTDKKVTYTPSLNYNGSDHYDYEVCNASNACSTTTVTIRINPINDPPIAADDSITINEDQIKIIDVLANDSDVDGDSLTISSNTQPAHGTAVITTDNKMLYTPDKDFNGLDSFSYTISDGHGGTDTAIVRITVQPVNDPPVAMDDKITTMLNTPVVIPVLSNDSDPDGDPLILKGFDTQSANHGTIIRDDSGTPTDLSDDKLVYTPPVNYVGADFFKYTISDGQLDDKASVNISVVSNPNAPVANNDNYSTVEGVTLNIPADSGVLNNDVNSTGSGALTATLVTNPSHGVLTFKQDGSFTYTPNASFSGTDQFEYKAFNGTSYSNVASVQVTVEAAVRPVANDDKYQSDQDVPLVVAAPGVLENDTDPLGLSLSAIAKDEPVHGTLQLNSNGSFIYTPQKGFIGLDQFTYQAKNSLLKSSTASVQITIVDSQLPTINWTSPVGDESRYDVDLGTVNLEVAASDNVGIASVRFFRWDAVNEQFVDIATVNQSPYQVDLDTRSLNFGWNQIFARAYDMSGNASQRQFIWIYQTSFHVLPPRVFLPAFFH